MCVFVCVCVVISWGREANMKKGERGGDALSLSVKSLSISLSRRDFLILRGFVGVVV